MISTEPCSPGQTPTTDPFQGCIDREKQFRFDVIWLFIECDHAFLLIFVLDHLHRYFYQVTWYLPISGQVWWIFSFKSSWKFVVKRRCIFRNYSSFTVNREIRSNLVEMDSLIPQKGFSIQSPTHLITPSFLGIRIT